MNQLLQQQPQQQFIPQQQQQPQQHYQQRANDDMDMPTSPSLLLDIQDVTTKNRAQNPNNMTGPDGQPIPLIRFHFAPYDPLIFQGLTPGNERQELLILARQAESAERYADMALTTRYIALVTGGRLSREERTLFFISHKRIILPLRQTIRSLNQHYSSPLTRQLSADYRKNIEYELKTLCKSLIDFVLAVILPQTLADHQVFFLKFIGDCYRYIAELNPIRDSAACSLCRSYYHDAAILAEHYLSITSPIRLGLLLNYSVAAFELFRDYKTACEMIKSAFDKAITRLEELDEEDYRDSTLLLQLMRDNLALWVTMQHSQVYPTIFFPPGLDVSKLRSHPAQQQRIGNEPQQPTQQSQQQQQRGNEQHHHQQSQQNQQHYQQGNQQQQHHQQQQHYQQGNQQQQYHQQQQPQQQQQYHQSQHHHHQSQQYQQSQQPQQQQYQQQPQQYQQPYQQHNNNPNYQSSQYQSSQMGQ